jgi:hypothetical protein
MILMTDEPTKTPRTDHGFTDTPGVGNPMDKSVPQKQKGGGDGSDGKVPGGGGAKKF